MYKKQKTTIIITNKKMKRTIILSMFSILSSLCMNAQVENDSLSAPYDSIDWERYLDQVTITAVKPLIKIESDKLAYDVANDVESKSSTVLDILRKVPMVTVDGQDNIMVNGSSSFKVYVNGKPNPMFSQNASQIFKMLPASTVSKIEVITNPGAKYDAEGSVGVLNIIMSSNMGGGDSTVNGITGTVRGAVGSRGYNGGVSFTGQEGKLSLSGNLMNGYQRLSGIEHSNERTVFAESSTLLQTLKTTQRIHFTMGNINMNYNIDSLNVVSASFGVTGFRLRNHYNPHIDYSGGLSTPAYHYTYEGSMKMKNISYDITADWQHFFNSERNKYLVLSYMLSHTPQESEMTQRYESLFPDIYNQNRPKSLEQTVQFDYTMPVGLGQTVNLGTKYINRRNKSLSEYYILSGDVKTLQEENTMDYRHTSNIGAAYAEYEANVGVFGAKAGIRYEHTWQKVEYAKGLGEDFDLDYGNLVPSVSLSFRPGLTQNIGLTYNMRISRPGITYLNPYIDRSNPVNITYGNTNLDVEKNHNIGLSYGSFSTKLIYNVSFHQTFCNDRISEYSFYKDEMLYTTYGNIVKERNSSLSAFINWLVFPNTRILMNGELEYTDLRSNQLAQSNHGWSSSLFVGIQQTLPWDLKLGLNGVINSKSYSLQGWSSGFQIAMASLTKSFMDDRLNISLQGVLGLNKGCNLNLDTYTKGHDFSNMQTIKVPISQFNISISYSFGNTKVRAQRHKSRIENDFTERQSEQEQMGTTTTTGISGQDM